MWPVDPAASRADESGRWTNARGAAVRKAKDDRALDALPSQFGVRQVQLSSTVKATADVLREEVFRIREPGVYFGKEADLVAQLGVSRASFRQAVRVLEHEQLLETRRGVGGGLYTRRPNGDAVSHFAAIYLIAAKAPLADVMSAVAMMRNEAVRAVAADPDVVVRARLREYMEEQRGFLETRDYRIIQRVVGGYNRLLAQLCRNPVLELFLEVVRKFANDERWDAEFSTDEAATVRYVDYIYEQAEAIASGDVDRAADLAVRQGSVLERWTS